LINESLRDSATTQIHSANDLVRYLLALRRLRIDPRTGRPITAFAPEAQVYDPFEALAYAKGGMVTKAPPAPAPAVSSWYVSAWGQGSGDQEHRDVRRENSFESDSRRPRPGAHVAQGLQTLGPDLLPSGGILRAASRSSFEQTRDTDVKPVDRHVACVGRQ